MSTRCGVFRRAGLRKAGSSWQRLPVSASEMLWLLTSPALGRYGVGARLL